VRGTAYPHGHPRRHVGPAARLHGSSHRPAVRFHRRCCRHAPANRI